MKPATELVMEASSGRLPIEDFIAEYNNFYHYNALDGHESTPSERTILKSVQPLVEFHEHVQNLLGLVYLGPKEDLEAYLRAGRITPERVREVLAELVTKFKPLELFDTLSNQSKAT